MTKEQIEVVKFLLNKNYTIYVNLDKVSFEIMGYLNPKRPMPEGTFLIVGNSSTVNGKSIPSNSVFIYLKRYNVTKRVFNELGECFIIYGPELGLPGITSPLLYNLSSTLLTQAKPGDTVIIKPLLDTSSPYYINWGEQMVRISTPYLITPLHQVFWTGTYGEFFNQVWVIPLTTNATGELNLRVIPVSNERLHEDEPIMAVAVGDYILLIPSSPSTHSKYGVSIVLPLL